MRAMPVVGLRPKDPACFYARLYNVNSPKRTLPIGAIYQKVRHDFCLYNEDISPKTCNSAWHIYRRALPEVSAYFAQNTIV